MLKRSCLSLTFVFFIFSAASTALAAGAFDDSKITKAEKQEAEEIAMQFTLRFARNKDIAPLIKDYYRTDFIERYKKELSNTDEKVESSVPFLSYQPWLLKEQNSPDIERFYVASNNFFLNWTLSVLKEIEKGKDLKLDDMFSPRLKQLFTNNPNLSGLIDLKGQGEFKPISSLQELRDSAETLSKGTEIFNEDNNKPISQATLIKACKAFFNGKLSKTRAETTHKEYHGFPKGERVISVVTPLMLSLELTKTNGKLKIFATIPYAE